MNTYTHGMFRDFDEAIIRARFDDKVTAIVITGAGEKFFSAGASIKMLNSVSPGFKYNFCLPPTKPSLASSRRRRLSSRPSTATLSAAV